ncbi:MAG TPA: hypothetical protein V6C84_26210 [Coleofasciculaceae cyanobacterium]
MLAQQETILSAIALQAEGKYWKNCLARFSPREFCLEILSSGCSDRGRIERRSVSQFSSRPAKF